MFLFTFVAFTEDMRLADIALHIKARTRIQALRQLERTLHNLGAATARPGTQHPDYLLDSEHRADNGYPFSLMWLQESSERLPDSN